jgi:hypothetical protein
MTSSRTKNADRMDLRSAPPASMLDDACGLQVSDDDGVRRPLLPPRSARAALSMQSVPYGLERPEHGTHKPHRQRGRR